MYYIFNNINDYKRKELMKTVNFQSKTYYKGDCIFNENDKCNFISLIKKGHVIAKNLFDDTHEIIIKTLSSGDSFGEGLIFSESPLYKASFIAQDTVEIIHISYENILSLMKQNQTIMLNILKKLNEESHKQMNHIKLLSLKKVSSKVASFFYLKYIEANKKAFNLVLNKTQIAQYLNIERPTFSKELNYLIKNNIISYNHKQYEVLDPNLLVDRI